ncbi:MAG: exonuclease domain-containing protein [Pseudomonadota bacterium]
MPEDGSNVARDLRETPLGGIDPPRAGAAPARAGEGATEGAAGAWHDRIPLRLRVFLFFALLAAGGAALIAGGALWALSRAPEGARGAAAEALLLAGAVSALGLSALCLWVWLMFDENVARPMLRLAAEMTTRARAPVDAPVEEGAARYLGALAPAAQEIGAALSEARAGLNAQVARRTAELARQTHRLEAVLGDLAEGVVVCTPDHRIALCNDQARRMLDGCGALGLGRRFAPAAEAGPLADGLQALEAGAEEPLRVLLPVSPFGGGGGLLRGRLALVRGPDATEGYVLTLRDPLGQAAAGAAARIAARPEFYDFGVMERPAAGPDAPLDAAVFVVFDTETTGLHPAAGDEIVQIGAVRIAGGRVLRGEVFETLVNPRRAIPPPSTAIHGIDDAMVAGAPAAAEAVGAFHRFAEGAALVAHNAPFDLAFLRRAEGAAGVRFDHPVLDTVLLSAVAWPDESDHTLDGVARRLGVEADPALRHTALGDARMTAEAFVTLMPVLARQGCASLAEAEAACLAQGALRRKQAAQAAAR